MTYTVDVAVACGGSQKPEWWLALWSILAQETQKGIEIGQLLGVSSALPDHNKNASLAAQLPQFERELFETKQRHRLTDANRSAASYGFLVGNKGGNKSDWVWWIDDDTIPPPGALSKLLDSGKDFIAGEYYLGRWPFNPLAYVKSEEGWGYKALFGHPAGSLFQVDAVGMGCTLIHRSVFEKIQAEHHVYRRPNGSLIPIHQSKIVTTAMGPAMDNMVSDDEQMVDGYLIQKMYEPDPDDNRYWPFFAMEYVRTEDYHFCELAANVGIRPWIDSTIQCKHLKGRTYERADYLKAVEEAYESEGEDEGSGI